MKRNMYVVLKCYFDVHEVVNSYGSKENFISPEPQNYKPTKTTVVGICDSKNTAHSFMKNSHITDNSYVNKTDGNYEINNIVYGHYYKTEQKELPIIKLDNINFAEYNNEYVQINKNFEVEEDLELSI